MKTRRRLQAPASPHPEIIVATRKWLERAVIGLNLCPFARGVHAKGQLRYVVSVAQNGNALLDDAGPDGIVNHTTRAPYPALHLVHENSLALAMTAFPDAAADVYQRNIETLRTLGLEGWQALGVGAAAKPKQ